ncbi:hypothetical protein [Capnocytophaga canis]|uniref:hypothetical protein n=1 Tax=Capnocytophaga canis TaxID=1848903 RepID=UPI001562C476|nr:hypothetical protein [Capnocytophaga canis]
MADCLSRLGKDLLFDCADKPSAGIEQEVVLINREDIDWAGTTKNGNTVTSLTLKSGKSGYKVKGMKKHLTFDSKPVIDEGINGFKHTFHFRVYKNSAEDYEQIDSIFAGANLVAIVERTQKGAQAKNAFEILGLNLGMEASGDSGGLVVSENEGTFLISIATPDGTKEPNSIMKWLETDYATTKAKFDNKLAD